MRSVQSSIGSTVVAICVVAIVGCGGADTSTPKGTVKAMFDAMKKGDAETVKSLTVNGDPKLLEMLTSMMASNKQLEDAATAKFGADGASVLGEQDKVMGDMDKKLETAEVKENGDTATITVKDSPDPLTLTKVNGQWKVDLSKAPHMPTAAEMAQLQPVFNAMLDVNKQLAADISAGKFKTAAEAKDAKQQKLMAAMMSFQKGTPK